MVIRRVPFHEGKSIRAKSVAERFGKRIIYGMDVPILSDCVGEDQDEQVKGEQRRYKRVEQRGNEGFKGLRRRLSELLI